MKSVVRPLLAVLTFGVVASAGALVSGGIAAAAPSASGAAAYVLHDLQCDQHDNGVLDITLVNDDPSAPASFTVATSAVPKQYDVAALSARALTMTDLADGPVVVPVMVDGVSSQVAVTVACDQPEVEVLPPTVAPTTTVVASSPAHPVVTPTTAPATVPAGPSATTVAPADGVFVLPSTGSSVRGLVIGGVLVVAGIAASLLARRRYS